MPALSAPRLGMLWLEGCTPAPTTMEMLVNAAVDERFDFSAGTAASGGASDSWLPSASSESERLRWRPASCALPAEAAARPLKERAARPGSECSAAMLCRPGGAGEEPGWSLELGAPENDARPLRKCGEAQGAPSTGLPCLAPGATASAWRTTWGAAPPGRRPRRSGCQSCRRRCQGRHAAGTAQRGSIPVREGEGRSGGRQNARQRGRRVPPHSVQGVPSNWQPPGHTSGPGSFAGPASATALQARRQHPVRGATAAPAWPAESFFPPPSLRGPDVLLFHLLPNPPCAAPPACAQSVPPCGGAWPAA